MNSSDEVKRDVMTAWVCPDCGENVTEQGVPWGHYHDPPENWPDGEDPWFDAVKVPVVPLNRVRERIEKVLAEVEQEATEAPELTGRTILVVKAEGIRTVLATFPSHEEVEGA